MAVYQVIPALLGVEHGGPQLAPRLDPCGGEGLCRHPNLRVSEALEPECTGQPTSGIHRQHQDLAAQVSGRHQRGRSRGGGLANATRPTRDHDFLGGQQLLQGADLVCSRRLTGRGHYNSSARNSATWRVARAPWLRVNK